MIGYALTGSFCTHKRSLEVLRALADYGHELLPIVSDCVYSTDTRFGTSSSLCEELKKITGKEIIHTVVDAEPLGPKIHLDAMIISPCTGNTLAKLARGITDTPVTMAAKAHLRSNRPLVIALSSNDALSANLQSIGILLERKHVYFVPLSQDDPRGKPHSLVCDFSLVHETLKHALCGEQLQPIFK